MKTQHTLHIPSCGSVDLELGTWNVQSWLHDDACMVLTIFFQIDMLGYKDTGQKRAVYVHVCVEWDSVKALVLVELLENENPRSRLSNLGHKEAFSK